SLTSTSTVTFVPGFAQQNANADLAVGAVYDRAVFAVEWDERAVIDRAYSRKWAANFLLCKAPGAISRLPTRC
ncbi:MAG TPA: hypothetical protein VMT78_07445, partial [Terriglobia bacterium]|nr:hypothetical protein [Terriglobia bacterium]